MWERKVKTDIGDIPRESNQRWGQTHPFIASIRKTIVISRTAETITIPICRSRTAGAPEDSRSPALRSAVTTGL